MKVHLDVRYKAGHSYPEDWSLGELYCPSCGTQTVWEEEGPGDHCVGSGYLCETCKSTFTIQGPNKSGYTEEQVLVAIEAERATPLAQT